MSEDRNEQISNLNYLLSVSAIFLQGTLQHEKLKVHNAFEIWGNFVNWGSDILFYPYHSTLEKTIITPLVEFMGEATSDIQCSIFAVIHGMYRLSMMALRSCLELILTGLYYQLNPKEHQKYEQKRRVIDQQTIFFNVALNDMFKRDPYMQFDARYNLKQEIKDLYYELSGFIHARGVERQEGYLGHPTRIGWVVGTKDMYNKDAFDEWYSYLTKVCEIANIIFFLYYPDVLINPYKIGSFDPNTPFKVINMLTEKRKRQLETIFSRNS